MTEVEEEEEEGEELSCVSWLHVLTVSKKQVTRIVLLWVNNHFNDFEGDPAMTRFLEEFEKLLETTVSSDIRLYLLQVFAPWFCTTGVIELLFTWKKNSLCFYHMISLWRQFWAHRLSVSPPSSENEGPFASAEHRVCSQGQVETDHAAEGVPGVAAPLQRAGRQRERLRHLRGVGGGREQSCRGRTQTWRPGERKQHGIESAPEWEPSELCFENFSEYNLIR